MIEDEGKDGDSGLTMVTLLLALVNVGRADCRLRFSEPLLDVIDINSGEQN